VGRLSDSLVVFAQAQEGAAPGSGWITILTLWAPLILIFYFLLIRPQRREQARREAMIRAVKPNDHVVTAGGIHGVVTNVHSEAGTVTIRVDDNNSTKLKISLSAIARVIGEEASRESGAR